MERNDTELHQMQLFVQGEGKTEIFAEVSGVLHLHDWKDQEGYRLWQLLTATNQVEFAHQYSSVCQEQ